LQEYPLRAAIVGRVAAFLVWSTWHACVELISDDYVGTDLLRQNCGLSFL
jgi:hypothetical protein